MLFMSHMEMAFIIMEGELRCRKIWLALFQSKLSEIRMDSDLALISLNLQRMHQFFHSELDSTQV